MPTGYNWTTYQQAVVTQIPTVLTDPNFLVELPNSVDYSELSLYRDLDFLCMKGPVEAINLAGSNGVGLPLGVIAVESAYFLNGTNQVALCPLSIDAMQAIYGTGPVIASGAATGVPQYYAIVGGAGVSGGNWTPSLQLVLGPKPNAQYAIFAYCSQRAPPLSAANPTNFIWSNLPDLAWAAAMIYWSGVLKNFGAAGYVDDPQMSVTWNKEYQRLLAGARVEQDRLKLMSNGWQAMPPATLAQPRT